MPVESVVPMPEAMSAEATPSMDVIGRTIFTEDNALIVRDRGVGISEDDLSRITEPFYMADKSRSRKNGGAGLGLSLVDAICRRYGMTLSFESRVGVGTEAKITF